MKHRFPFSFFSSPVAAFCLLPHLFPEPCYLILIHIRPLIITLHLLDNYLHLSRLPLPLFLAHLRLALKQLIVRLPITTPQPIP